MKKLLILCLSMLLVACDDTSHLSTSSSEPIRTATEETEYIGCAIVDPNTLVYDDVKCTELFEDYPDASVALYSSVITDSRADNLWSYNIEQYIGLDHMEDGLFIINQDMWYLGRYADDMYLYDYDYSWLDDTYTIVNYTNRLRNVTYNNDGSVIDIRKVLNGINDETILVWGESFFWGVSREERDLVLGNVKRYFDEYNYAFIGVRFKDSYLKRYFESDLVALEDSSVIENDGTGFVRIDFGRFYKVFTDEGDEIIIRLVPYEDDTIIIIEMLYEDQYKKVMLVSDLDLKEVMGYK